MAEFSCKYAKIDNWQESQKSLIEFYNRANIQDLWEIFSQEEMLKEVPEVVSQLEKNGIIPLQLIFFAIPGPTNLESTSPDDPTTPYLHVDKPDNEQSSSTTRVLTTFVPNYVFNIPLINCESSETLFYEWTDKDKKEVQWNGWGPEHNENTLIEIHNVKFLESIRLDKPAFLKVSIPHAVHNPTNDHRLVASFRISGDSPQLTELLGADT